MGINWKTLEKDGTPKPRFGKPLYITCIVWVAAPESLIGGLPEVCRWDIKNNEWLKEDLKQIWAISVDGFCEVTHYCDDFNVPTNQ